MEAARRITGMRPQKRRETWVYPKSVNVRRAARVKTIAECITDRRLYALLHSSRMGRSAIVSIILRRRSVIYSTIVLTRAARRTATDLG